MRLGTLACALAVVGAAMLASGCASVTGTTNQSVSIQTVEPEGKELRGALCELTNEKGKWFVTTPGSTMITRSNDDMQVTCSKEGFEPGRASVVSATKGSMFGNIILGGGIGAIVDHNTGAAYEYPTFFQVRMGTVSRIEPPKDQPPGTSPPTTTPAASSDPKPAAPAPQTMPALQATSREEKLRELKRLHDEGLISKEVYADQQRKVMDAR